MVFKVIPVKGGFYWRIVKDRWWAMYGFASTYDQAFRNGRAAIRRNQNWIYK